MAETSTVRGRKARFTRLDELGRPLYGPSGQAVTKGIISVTYTPNVTEGEATSVTNFAGEQCISAPAPCATIDNWTVAVEFCAVDPCVVLMIYPSWIPYYDDFGSIKGFQIVGGLSCDVGFALEIWGQIGSAGSSVQCGPGAVSGSTYWLAPRLVGAAPGEITISNESTSFTFSGTTTGPVGWRRGPYLVDIVGGIPSVLREPVDSAAQLVEFTTQVRPPEPTNGCVELPRPVPEEASVIIDRVPNDATGMCSRLIIDNHGFGPVSVNWGDGSDSETSADCSTVTHCYTTPGTYTVCVADQQTPAISTCRELTVPMPDDRPTMTLAVDPSDPMCVIATIDMPPQSDGRVEVRWGDDTANSTVTVTPGTPAELRHCYATPGVYSIRAVRAEQPDYYATDTVVVPIGANPTISAAVAGNVVTLTVDNHGGGLTSVTWGDGQTSSGPALDGGTVPHTYADDGTYSITVTSMSNPLSSTTIQVTVGTASGLVASVDADGADVSGMTVDVTWNNA
jgi:hypothetical protein